MLRYSFGREDAATAIENAVKQTIADGFRTGDIADGATSIGTNQMGQKIAERIK
jgi:3-isopropylmalate dehydrogenase